METAGDETENLGGCVVEPLRVVDDTDERLLLGYLREERQRGQPHEKAVRRWARAEAEHRGKGVALRIRQVIDSIHHRRAELMKPAVRELHLGLDTYRSSDMPARDSIGHVVEQGALAHTRFATKNDDAASTRKRVSQDPVEPFALTATSEESGRSTTFLARVRPPDRSTTPNGRGWYMTLHRRGRVAGLEASGATPGRRPGHVTGANGPAFV